MTCKLCELHESASENCVANHNITERTSILVVLSEVPQDTMDFDTSQLIEELHEHIKSVYPNEKIGFTSVIRCAERFDVLKTSHAKKCADYHFTRLMRRIKPKLIIALGGHAAKYLVKGTNTSPGGVYKTRWGQVVVTKKIWRLFDSDTAMEEFKRHILAEGDQDKIKRLMAEGKIKIANNKKDIHAFYQKLKTEKRLFYDIEASSLPYTKSLVPHVCLSCSFSPDSEEIAYVFPLDLAVPWYKERDAKAYAWKAVKMLLANESEKVLHNGKYDIMYLRWVYGINTVNFKYDTLLMSYLIDERPPHDLKSLAGQTSPDLENYEDVLKDYISKHKNCKPSSGGSYFFIPNDVLLPYNGVDTIACRRIFREMMPEIKENKKYNWLLTKVKVPVTKVYMEMEKNGFRVDVKGMERDGAALQKAMNEAHQNIIKHLAANGVSPKLNPDSPEEIASVLLKLGEATEADLNWSEKKRKYTIDDQGFAKLINRGSKLVKFISVYRKKSKLKGTYIDAPLKKADKEERVRCSYYIHIADTGRSTSRDPNFQNIPRYIRKYYIASKNRVLLEFDWSQLELRLMACVSKDPVMLYLFRNGHDAHTMTASGSKKSISMDAQAKLISEHKIDELVRQLMEGYSHFDTMLQKTFRRQAKSTNFHLIYGGMQDSLMKRINNDIAKEMKDMYIQMEMDPTCNRDLIRKQLKELEAARVTITCRDCGFTAYTPFKGTFNKKTGKNERTCPKCRSIDLAHEAAEFYEAYFRLYPNVSKFHDYIDDFVSQTGYAESYFGRRKHVPDVFKGGYDKIKALNKAKNHPIQSAGADLKFMTLIKIQNFLWKEKLQTLMVNEVHDSVILDVPYAEVEHVYSSVLDIMESWPSVYSFLQCPLTADCKIGKSWGVMDEVKGGVDFIKTWMTEKVGV